MKKRRLGIFALTIALVASSCGSTNLESVADLSAPTAEGESAPLVSCASVPQASSAIRGVLENNRNPDELLMGVVFTYTEQNPDTFAGLWIDRANGGTVVVAFTDDPEPHRAALASRGPPETDIATVEPRIPITDDRPLSERDDFVFDVVQLEFPEAELFEVHDRLWEAIFATPGSGLQSGGPDTLRNRASFDLIDPTPEGLAEVAELIDGEPVCVTITRSPEPPAGPLDIIPEPGQPVVFPPGLAEVRWELDPAFGSPEPADTEIHVLATEIDCANGRVPGEALRGPQVVETETEVLIAFAVVPVAGGADCPGNPATEVTVTLSEPLGQRTLRNGATTQR